MSQCFILIFVLHSVSDSWPSAGKPLWINDCYHPADESITPLSGEKRQECKKTLILTTGAGQLMVPGPPSVPETIYVGLIGYLRLLFDTSYSRHGHEKYLRATHKHKY